MMELPAQLWMISFTNRRAKRSLVGRLPGLLTAASRSSKRLYEVSASKLPMYSATPCTEQQQADQSQSQMQQLLRLAFSSM